MRKVKVLNRVTLDGYFAGPKGEFDWFVQDPEVDEAAHHLVQADMTVLGAATYKLLERSWIPFLTNPEAPAEAKAVAQELTSMKKVVFSTSLTEASWENTDLHTGNVPETVRRLKSEATSDLLVMGSGTIVRQLAKEGLVDEYVLIVTPVVLGAGKPLFEGIDRFCLTLLETRSFASGNTLLHYAANGEAPQ